MTYHLLFLILGLVVLLLTLGLYFKISIWQSRQLKKIFKVMPAKELALYNESFNKNRKFHYQILKGIETMPGTNENLSNQINLYFQSKEKLDFIFRIFSLVFILFFIDIILNPDVFGFKN